MRLYDKIWVLMSDDEISEPVKAMNDFFMTVPRKCITNKIVLSPEELIEIWAVANERGYHIGQYGNPGGHPQSLHNYLETKGIVLP